MTQIMVQVPAGDREDLEALALACHRESEVLEAKPFDGLIFLTLVLPLVPGVVAALKEWLTARESRLARTRLHIAGRTFDGFSAREIEGIMRAVERNMTTEGGDSLPSSSDN